MTRLRQCLLSRSNQYPLVLALLVVGCSKGGDAEGGGLPVDSPELPAVPDVQLDSVGPEVGAPDANTPDIAKPDVDGPDVSASETVGLDTTTPIAIVAPTYPPPEVWDSLPLPKLADGRMVLIELPGIQLVVDPKQRTPVVALAHCVTMIMKCSKPPSHSLDDCVAAAPDCVTAEPWSEPKACCPSACRGAYAAGRASGQSPMDALDGSYFQRPGCFPGIAAPEATP